MLVRAAAGHFPRALSRLLRCAARASALASLLRCPPARGLAGEPRDDALAFFVKREGSADYAEVEIPASSDVVTRSVARGLCLHTASCPRRVTLLP